MRFFQFLEAFSPQFIYSRSGISERKTKRSESKYQWKQNKSQTKLQKSTYFHHHYPVTHPKEHKVKIKKIY